MNSELQGLYEGDAAYCARIDDAALRRMAHRWWLCCEGDRLRAARAEAQRRGIAIV